MNDPHHNEAAQQRAGADEATFLKRCLLPALAAALLLSLYLVMRVPEARRLGPVQGRLGVDAGRHGHLCARLDHGRCSPKTWVPCRDEKTGNVVETRDRRYWLRDFAAWLGAGAVYGVIIGLGVHIVAKFLPWLLIGNAFVDHKTGVFLLAFIFGIPWLVSAQSDRRDGVRRPHQLAAIFGQRPRMVRPLDRLVLRPRRSSGSRRRSWS